MNLLNDKRDEERPLDTASNGSLSEDQFQPTGAGIDETPQRAVKSKNTLSTLLIAAAIFIIAILITYFGFYKPKEGGRFVTGKTPSAQIDSTDKTVNDSAASQTADQRTEQPGPVSSITQTQSAGESSLVAASDVMQTIQDALGGGRVTAIFLDEGSFSTEVDAGSVQNAEDIYNAIKAALPAYASVTSSTPTGSNALITGSFSARSISTPTGLAESEIDAALRQLASDAGTTVSSLSIDAPAGEQSFVVMRVAGSLDACRLFVKNLAQKSWNISVSKLILMSGSGDDYTFVLRFYL